MNKGNVQIDYSSDRLPHETNPDMMNCRNQYGIPANYNPADHPQVKLRNDNSSDRSETQRKRRSKNRLSNRRSTGYVSSDLVEEAIKLGTDGKPEENGHKQ